MGGYLHAARNVLAVQRFFTESIPARRLFFTMVAPRLILSIEKSSDVAQGLAAYSAAIWCRQSAERRDARKLVSSCFFKGRRFGRALLMTFFLFGFVVPESSATSIYTPRVKIAEGVNLSNPHRTAIGIACSEQRLHPGMSMTELGLAAASANNGTYVESITAKVESKKRAMIVISYKEIGSVVRRGDIVVYFATCGPNGTSWKISGTLPRKYWPKQ